MSRNYSIMEIGTLKEDLVEKGWIMVGQELGLTGSDILCSFKYTTIRLLNTFLFWSPLLSHVSSYDTEKNNIKNPICELQEEIRKLEANKTDVNKFVEIIKKYKSLPNSTSM